MSFDAGQLVFKIQSVGAQVFKTDMAGADQSIEKTGKSADAAKPKLEQLGTATDTTGAKAKAAKPALEGQAKATEAAGTEAAKAAPKQQTQAQATEKQTANARQLSVALIAAGVAVAALVTLSVVKFAEFDNAMSNVQAATMATAQEQKALGESALEAGADTAYSASEAAAAQEELAKAGLTTADIIGGSLTGALSLAAAGELAVARSAEIMATTLKQFKLPAKDAAHVSDLLAAGAGKAQGSVDDLALALQYVGPVAAGLGISLEETTGTLALFAEQGQLGERAGTGLRGVLMALTAPSAIAAKTMKEYNVEIFDGNGKMKSMAQVAEELKRAFGHLTEEERSAALGRIFGNEQITAARVLYEGGAKAVNKWTDEVNQSGFAAEQAAIRQDNLAGDIEKLGGALDTALIRTGSGANDALRTMTQGLTELVDWFGELPEPVQQVALVLGVAAAAVLLFSGAALGAVSKFGELRDQLELMNISMTKTAIIGAAVGLALTGVVTIVALLAASQAEARAKAEGYAAALDNGAEAARNFAIQNLQADKALLWANFGSAYDNAEKLGISVDLVTDATIGQVDAQEKLNAVLDLATGGGEEAQAMADELGISYLDLSQSAATLRDAVKGEAEAQERANVLREQAKGATDKNTDSTKTAAETYKDAKNEIKGMEEQLTELIDIINEANGVGQDAITANINYQDALRDVDEQIANVNKGAEGYKKTLDITTQAGADNKKMLVGLAEDAIAAAKAQFALDQNTDNYRATIESSRQALIDRARDFGANAEEAAALADQILRIPAETEWTVVAETQRANDLLQGFMRTWDGKRLSVYVDAKGGQTYQSTPGGVKFNKDGGHVEFFGNGGIRENHVAQMARAGTVRVWAEPETEGETYIPHARSKRARSEQILAETATMFGGAYIPGGAGMQSFSDGSAPAAGTQNVFNITMRDAPDMTGAEIVREFTDEIDWLVNK